MKYSERAAVEGASECVLTEKLEARDINADVWETIPVGWLLGRVQVGEGHGPV